MADSTQLNASSSPEIGRMFKLGPSVEDKPGQTSSAPANLPLEEEDMPIEVMEQQQMEQSSVTRPQLQSGDDAVTQSRKHQTSHSTEKESEHKEAKPTRRKTVVRVTTKITPYLVVFAIGLGIYFFYANTFSFSSIFKGNGHTTKVKSNAALVALEKTESNSYNAWISQFFFDVSDSKIIDMDTDVSGNGLTNFQKYLLNLNPKMFDTLGDNTGDGQKIIEGKNPWTGQDLTDQQKKIAETYFDNEAISNRIAAAQANRDNTAFAPYVSNNSPYFQAGISDVNNGNSSTAGQVAGVSVGTTTYQNPTTTNTKPVTRTTITNPNTTTGNSVGAGNLDINTAIPGEVNIPSIKTTIPLIWSSDAKNFETDLRNGVIHYPGTPLPGEMGTSYISGHSSGYFWDKSQYKLAFAKLGDVKNGDSFTITVTLKSGQKAILHYRVDGRAEYQADDPKQFLQSSDSVVALSTCWPLNTTARRLVLYGNLTQVEK